MSDTQTKTQTGAIFTTTGSHNSNEDVTFFLPNTAGLAAKMEVGSGTIAVATAGTAVTLTVTFPTPFKNPPQIESVSLNGASVGTAGYINLMGTAATATQFTLTANSYVAQTLTFDWVAVGV
jgi:hypothetical protein